MRGFSTPQPSTIVSLFACLLLAGGCVSAKVRTQGWSGELSRVLSDTGAQTVTIDVTEPDGTDIHARIEGYKSDQTRALELFVQGLGAAAATAAKTGVSGGVAP